MAFTKITHAGIGSTGTVLLENLEVTGVGTFGGSVSVGGTLTYEDVTNIDSVGLVTARNGIVVGSGITLSKDGDGFFTGIVTATSFSGSGANLTGIDTDLVSDTSPQLGGNLDTNSFEILLDDDHAVKFGDDNDLQIKYDSSSNTNEFTSALSTNFRGKNLYFYTNHNNSSEPSIMAYANAAVELYYDNSKKLETTNAGVSVTGSATVSGDLSIAASLVHTGDTDTKITFANNVIKFDTDTNERLRIDNNGKVLIGATSGINGFTDAFQIFKADSTAAITLKRASNNAYAPYINFIKSRGSTAADATVLQSGDIMAYIRFSGTDGTDTTESAIIQAVVDGTPGNNDMPGRLVFSTTADGSNASTERMRINSSGHVLIGADTQGSADGYTNNFMIAETSGSAGMSIQSYNSASSYTTLALGDRTTHNRGYIEQRCGDNNQMTIGLNGNGSFRFIGKDSGGSAAERIRITYDGITFNGDTAAANALDDYEEGTFVPSFLVGDSESGVTYSSKEGVYTKVGRAVTVNIAIELSNNGSTNGQVNIGGLPFTVGNILTNTSHEASGAVGYMANFGVNVYMLSVSAGNNTTILYLMGQESHDTSFGHIQRNQTSNTFSFRASITYFVS